MSDATKEATKDTAAPHACPYCAAELKPIGLTVKRTPLYRCTDCGIEQAASSGPSQETIDARAAKAAAALVEDDETGSEQRPQKKRK